MRIGDFAARAGLTARQVRHYTDTGLMPAIRLSNGYRDYNPADVKRARRVSKLLLVLGSRSDSTGTIAMTPSSNRDSTASWMKARPLWSMLGSSIRQSFRAEGRVKIPRRPFSPGRTVG